MLFLCFVLILIDRKSVPIYILYMNKQQAMQAKFTRTKNQLIRIHISLSIVSRVIRLRVKQGIYPEEFIELLKMKRTNRSIRSAFNSKNALKNSIWQRDKYTCTRCGILSNQRKLEIDHIEPMQFAPELAFEPTNLRLLCVVCHRKRHAKRKK